MLSEVLLALLAGGATAAMARLGTGHRSPAAFVLVALVGALGGVVGLFASRMMGVPREEEARVLILCAAFGLGVTLMTFRMARRVSAVRSRGGSLRR